MSEQPRNWDRELADIDKVIAKGSVPAAGGRRNPSAPPHPPRPGHRVGVGQLAIPVTRLLAHVASPVRA
jgi:hypothetical protein